MPTKPSIILLSIDSLRYDCVSWVPKRPHMDAAGIASPPATPNLDRLTQGAFCFTQAIANAPYTTSSHASLLTGLVPPQHGVRAFMNSSLAAGVTTLPEIVRQAGYSTLLMTDVARFLSPVGLARGFDHVVSDPQQALAWWHCHGNLPRFMLLHYLDVHLPYGFSKAATDEEINWRWLERNRERCRPEVGQALMRGRLDYPDIKKQLHRAHRRIVEGEDGLRRGLAWYLDGLAWFDSHRLRALVERLQEISAFDDSIVVVFGDHGEGHDPTSHYRLGHACLMFEDVIRVPLAIRHPDLRRDAGTNDAGGRRLIDAPCSLADITPTLLDWIGEQGRWRGSDHPWAGRSLAGLCGGEPAPERSVYAEYWSRFLPPGSTEMRWALRQRIVRTSRRKLSLIGRRVRGIADWDGLAPEAFAERLYADVLGRHPTVEDVRRRARWARWGGRLGRWLEYQRVARSAEAQRPPKIALYDLDQDPLETSPRQPWSSAAEACWARETIETMEQLDRDARPGGPLLLASGEERLVEARLAELGYLD